MEREEKHTVVGGESSLTELELPSRRQEPLYNFHDVQFRSIIPEETWIKILNMLEQEDKESCVNASPYFWELLRKERVVFLFPRTFEVIALVFEQKYNVRNLKLSTSNEPYLDESFDEPEEFDDSWNGIVFNSRLVCSTWNKGVERCYENPAMSGIPEFVNEIDPRSKLNNLCNNKWTKKKFTIDFNDTEVLDEFIERFYESHHLGTHVAAKNPFLGRYLKITVKEYTTPQQRNSLTNLLNLFGKEVWYLELKFEVVDLGCTSVLIAIEQTLQTWLGLVPNLKFLQIRIKPRLKLVDWYNFGLIQFPKLKSVEVLYLESLPSGFGSELIRNYSHVTHLIITDMQETDLLFSRTKPWLQLSYLKNRIGVKNGNILYKLKYERECYVRTHYDAHPTLFLNVADAFNNVQDYWSDTLTEVYLQMPFGYDNETTLKESRHFRLRLEAVRKMTICTANLLFFLDFAVKFRHSLEHLEIQWDSESTITKKYQERMEKEQVIQLFGFENKMHMSNIWEFFDKLKTIKMNTDSEFFTIFTNAKEKIHYKLKTYATTFGNLWPSRDWSEVMFPNLILFENDNNIEMCVTYHAQ